MDRKNTANAAIAGMLVDLKMTTGFGYNIVTLSFFLSNVVAQPIMAILCRKFGPRLFLSSVCIAWGVVVVGLGLVHNWVSQVPLRLLLGLFEAGFGPGSIYLLSTWYTKGMLFPYTSNSAPAFPLTPSQPTLAAATPSST